MGIVSVSAYLSVSPVLPRLDRKLSQWLINCPIDEGASGWELFSHGPVAHAGVSVPVTSEWSAFNQDATRKWVITGDGPFTSEKLARTQKNFLSSHDCVQLLHRSAAASR